MTEKPASKTGQPAGARKPKTRQHKPSHEEISERAYFIDLEEGECDQFGNWLRAERELTAA